MQMQGWKQRIAWGRNKDIKNNIAATIINVFICIFTSQFLIGRTVFN